MVSAVLKILGRAFNFPGIVLLVWMATFIHLIRDDNYTFFIKPEFGFLIYAGLLICCAFFISGLANRPKKSAGQGVINGLIILMPVVFIFVSGDQTLNSYALSKRMLISPDLESPESNAAVTQPADQRNDIPIHVSLSQLLRNWSLYSGKQVSIEGLLHQSLVDNAEYALVFKYLISCCVADAMPVGIFIKKERTKGFNDDDWVRVTGVVNLDKMDGHDIVVMSLEAIEKTEKPSKNAIYMFF